MFSSPASISSSGGLIRRQRNNGSLAVASECCDCPETTDQQGQLVGSAAFAVCRSRGTQRTKAYASSRRDALGLSELREQTSDEILIRRIAAGDRAAIGTLFRRHNSHVFRFIARLVADTALAEEIVSDVFTQVWRQAGDFEGRSQVSTWILSIARYKALAARRRRREIELDAAAAESIPDHADTPEECVLRSDGNARLQACLKRLSREHREIIDLVYYHDRTIEEVAKIINVPKNTVKTRMFYARKRLAQLVAGHADFEPSIIAVATVA